MIYKKAGEGQKILSKDYSKRIILPLSAFKEPGHALQLVTIPPHTKQRAHVHFQQTEVIYVLAGKAIFVTDGKETSVAKGDALTYSYGEKHFVWNRSDKPCDLLVFKINMPEGSDDTKWLEE